MIDLTAWRDRLASLLDIDVDLVDNLAEAQTRISRDKAFVVSLDNAAAESGGGRPVRQMVTVGVAIILAITSRRGRGAGAQVETLRKAVADALLGWEPEGVTAPVHYRRGRLLQLADGVTWWQDEFETDFLLEEAG